MTNLTVVGSDVVGVHLEDEKRVVGEQTELDVFVVGVAAIGVSVVGLDGGGVVVRVVAVDSIQRIARRGRRIVRLGLFEQQHLSKKDNR